MSRDNYIVIDDPKERAVEKHKCEDGFPNLVTRGHGIWWKTVIECEECGKRWWAQVYTEDNRRYNKWVELKWHHFKIHKSMRKGRK